MGLNDKLRAQAMGKDAGILDDMPEAPAPIDQETGLPHSTRWVCREDVVWARADLCSVFYHKGTTIEVVFPAHIKPHRWDYARDFWVPEGVDVVDPKSMYVIPKQFEPSHPEGRYATIDLWKKILVDPSKLNYARASLPVGNSPVYDKDTGELEKAASPFWWKFEKENKKVEVEKQGFPDYIDPASLTKVKEEPEQFSPGELSRRI